MEEQVASFTSITGASAATARFYLEGTGGDVERAVSAFYDAGGAEAPPGGAGPACSSAAASGDNLMAQLAAERAARAAAAAGSGAGPSVAATGSRRGGGGGGRGSAGNVRSLGDIGNGDEESDDDDHNEYYAGGEKSGQVVRGAPTDKKRQGGDAIEDIFDHAREAGAEEGRAEDLRAGGGSGFRSFTGTGRTLAGGEVAPPPRAPEPQVRATTIAFYRNGVFTVDDGEPRRVDDPANGLFMQAIMRGQCPPELDPGDPHVQINVNLVRRDEDYTPPARPRHRAFAGTAHRLTDDAPGTSATAAPAPAPGSTAQVPWEGADRSLPTTSIQLRLADGSRMVAEFNLDHTVADIRRFIRASRPDMPAAYRLATAFPPKTLDDDAATIEAAGLANSVVVQKL